MGNDEGPVIRVGSVERQATDFQLIFETGHMEISTTELHQQSLCSKSQSF